MIMLRHDLFITLVVALYLVTAEARYYPPKPILRGGNAEISAILSDSPKAILPIGNSAVTAMHLDYPKPVLFAGDYPKVVIPIGNPSVASMLRDNQRDIHRGGNIEITAMPRDNSKPFLLAAIPEIFAMPHGNPKPNPHGGGSGRLNLLAMLREYTKALLNNPDVLRVHNHSESDNNLPISSVNKYTIKDNDLKESFNKMIKTVTKVNDERILSLKKFFELDNYLPQVSRSKRQKNPLIAIIMNTPNYKSKYDNLNINHLAEDPKYVMVNKKHKDTNMLYKLKEIKEDAFNLNEDDDESQEGFETPNSYLRVWKGCKKSAAKFCKKACQKAFKHMCNDYKCTSKYKRDGKKQCRKQCNYEFLKNDGNSSDE